MSVSSQTPTSDTPPLSLKLEVDPTSSPCSENLRVRASLKNVSKKVILVDNRNLWRYIHFEGPPASPEIAIKDIQDGFPLLRLPRVKLVLGDNFHEEQVPGEYVVKLLPSESMHDAYRNLLDDEFFNIKGEYSLLSTYKQYVKQSSKGEQMFVGEITSEPLKLDIPDCAVGNR